MLYSIIFGAYFTTSIRCRNSDANDNSFPYTNPIKFYMFLININYDKSIEA